MNKSFFTKLLCGVLTVVLLVSLVPIKSLAATNFTFSDSSKTLYLKKSDSYIEPYEYDMTGNASDSYTLKINDKPAAYASKYTYTWSVDDKDIVSIEMAGSTKTSAIVTAKKVGSTTIKCVIKEKTAVQPYKTLTATVTVKANAESVIISNAPYNNLMFVGAEYDFNQTMIAARGGDATDKTEWFVYSDSECNVESTIATVDITGRVTAIAPGVFYVVAKTYQSTSTKELGYTAVSPPVKVEAINTIGNITLTKSNQLSLHFDASVGKFEPTDFEVVNTSNNKRNYVNNIEYSFNRIDVKLNMYDEFQDGVTYKVIYDGKEKTINIEMGKPAIIEISDQTVVTGIATPIEYRVLNASGLDITSNVEVEFVSEDASLIDDNKVTLASGASIDVAVRYFDEATGKVIVSNTVKITAGAPDIVDIAGCAISSSDDKAPVFGSNCSAIEKGVSDKVFYVQVKDSKGNYYNANELTDAGLEFSTLYDGIVEIDETTGALSAVSAGSDYVKVKIGTLTATYLLAVSDDSQDSYLSISKVDGYYTGSDDLNQLNWSNICVNVCDKYTNVINRDRTIKVELVDGSNILSYNDTPLASGTYDSFTAKNGYIYFKPLASGTVTLKVSCGTLMPATIELAVAQYTDGEMDKYAIAPINDIDIDKVWGDSTHNEDYIKLSLYSVNASSQYIEKIDCDNSALRIELKDPKGNSIAASLTDGSYDISRDAVKSFIDGSYTVTAYKDEEIVANETFEVTDSGVEPVVKVINDKINKEDINLTSVNKCLAITDGYSLQGFHFISNRSDIVASTNSYVTAVPYENYDKTKDVGRCSLNDVYVRITKDSNGRVYEKALNRSISVVPPIFDTNLPSAPVVFTTTTDNSVTLNWGPAKDNGSTIVSYNIYKDGNKLVEVNGTDRTYRVSGLEKGTKYSFSITSTNKNGESTASDIVNAITGSNAMITLDKPTNLIWNETKAVWDGVENATKYSVQLYLDGTACGSSYEVDTNYFDFKDVFTNSGNYTFSVKAIGDYNEYLDSRINDESVGYSYVTPAPVITSETLSNGKVGVTYNQTIVTSSKATNTWRLEGSNIPKWLMFDETTGKISGQPTEAGVYRFTVTVANSSGEDSKQSVLTIEEAHLDTSSTTGGKITPSGNTVVVKSNAKGNGSSEKTDDKDTLDTSKEEIVDDDIKDNQEDDQEGNEELGNKVTDDDSNDNDTMSDDNKSDDGKEFSIFIPIIIIVLLVVIASLGAVIVIINKRKKS